MVHASVRSVGEVAPGLLTFALDVMKAVAADPGAAAGLHA